MLDPDTFTSPESRRRRAAGGRRGHRGRRTRVMATGEHWAFALVRPPGHHAEPTARWGSVCSTTSRLRAAHALAAGVARVAIVDYRRPPRQRHAGDVLRRIRACCTSRPISTRSIRARARPTRRARRRTRLHGERAAGGRAATPTMTSSSRSGHRRCSSSSSRSSLIVSAGFDAHERDPLAGMRVSDRGYTRSTHRLRPLAMRVCDGRMALVTEGGYDLPAC